jgi:hypothetical protein
MSYSLAEIGSTGVQIVTPETGMSVAGLALNQNFQALIPYAGATQNVNLNGQSISGAGSIVVGAQYPILGTGSLYLPGDGSGLTAPENAAWYFGYGDFTIEGFFNLTSLPTGGNMNFLSVGLGPYYGSSTYDAWAVLINGAGGQFILLDRFDSSGEKQVSWPVSFNANETHYIVIQRADDQVTLYFDGELVAASSDQWTGHLIDVAAVSGDNSLYVGVSDVGSYQNFYGLLDEVRVSNVGRYSGPSMIVPTSEFSTDGNTVLLYALRRRLQRRQRHYHPVNAGRHRECANCPGRDARHRGGNRRGGA